MPKKSTNEKRCTLFLNFFPCGDCGRDCGEESHSIYCELCCKWFHRKCQKLTLEKYYELSIDHSMYICKNPKCELSIFPFFGIDSIDFESTLFGDGLYPCKICSHDCLEGMECLQCDLCDEWFHTDCRYSRCTGEHDGFSAHDIIVDNHYEAICSEKCYVQLLPFSGSRYGTLVKNDIFLPKKMKPMPVREAFRKAKHDPSSKKLSQAFVKFDKFLDINCSHLSRNELNDDYFGDSELVLFHNNVRSLNKNIGSIGEIFQNCKKRPDILAISETKLKEDKDFPELEGFSFESEESSTNADGVGVYLSNAINYSLRKDLALGARYCEDLWLNVELDNKKFVLGIIYRHPGHKYNTFCNKLCKNLDKLNKTKSNYIIVGDLNIDLLKYNLVTDVTNYVNSLNSMGCNICIDRATRVTSNSSTCIDHVYTNLGSDKVSNDVLITDVSDHFSTLTKISGFTKTKDNADVYVRKSKLSDSEWEQFNSELFNLLDSKLPSTSTNYDVNYCAGVITDSYQTVVDKFMPLRKLSRKQKKRFNTKPWITKGLRISCNTKFELLDRSKSSGNSTDYQKYRLYLKIYSSLVKQSRILYYCEKAALYSQDKSKTWCLINELSKRKRKQRASLRRIRNENGQNLDDPQQIADCINKHFGSIGKVMASKFNKEHQLKNGIADPIQYVSANMKNCVVLKDTDLAEILKLISELELRKACGFDNISNRMLKATSHVIAPYIMRLYNNCMSQGIFPDTYKKAQVIPLYKGGDKGDVNSYRPISLLPILGKLLEKIISVRVVKFFDKFNLFCPQQFGFRKNFSTEYAILDIYEKMLKNLDSGISTCAIFLDLAKAFDSVSHNILLRKLERYGIRGNVLNFFQSYLHNRSQFVKIDDACSSSVKIEFGVPQGSILGPLLFLIYINDLPQVSKFFIRLFADDTFLCAQNEDLWLLEKEVNAELIKVYKWLASNKLTLNMDKSKCMIISKKRKTTNMSIRINRKELKHCDSYKYLGVYIDKNLSWKPHIEHLCKKVSKACGALAKTRHFVNVTTLTSIYYALFNSYVRYGLVAWGNAAPETLQPLISLNHRALRIMSFSPFGRVEIQPMFDFFKILNFDQIFAFESGKFVYKSKKSLLPLSTIASHFTREVSGQRHSVRNRNAGPSVVPFELLSTYAQKSIQHRTAKLWDEIPITVRNLEFFGSFKQQYKNHLRSVR